MTNLCREFALHLYDMETGVCRSCGAARDDAPKGKVRARGEEERSARQKNYDQGFSDALRLSSKWEADRDAALHRIALAQPGQDEFDPYFMRNLARTASGTSGSAQDRNGLDPKGAGPTRNAGDAHD